MRRPATLLLVVACVLTVAGVGMRHAGTFLVVSDPVPTEADAIVVLAGSTADRVLEAADLYATKVAPVVVLTRERRRPELDALAERGVVLAEPDEVAADALVGLGVPREAIRTLPERTDSTAREASVVADWACRSGLRRLVVVTSPAHTRRARAIFRQALGKGATVAIRPSRAAPFPARRWWSQRHAAKLVAFEWQKLAGYWLVERWRLASCEPPAVSRRPPS